MHKKRAGDDRPVEPPLAIPQTVNAFVDAFAKLGHYLTPNGDDSFSLVATDSTIVVELADLEAVTQGIRGIEALSTAAGIDVILDGLQFVAAVTARGACRKSRGPSRGKYPIARGASHG